MVTLFIVFLINQKANMVKYELISGWKILKNLHLNYEHSSFFEIKRGMIL